MDPAEDSARPFGPRLIGGQLEAHHLTPESHHDPLQDIAENIPSIPHSRRPFGPRTPQRKQTVDSDIAASADSSLHLSVLWANPINDEPQEAHETPRPASKFRRPLPKRPRNTLDDSTRRKLPATSVSRAASQDVPFSFNSRSAQNLNIHTQDPLKDPFSTQEGLPSDAPLWKDYMEEAKRQDGINVSNWNQSMDVILIFAGLFSAILTAFLIEFYKPLQADPDSAMLNQLVIITSVLQGPSIGQNASVIASPQTYNPSIPIVAVNALWFVSLTCSLGAAIGAMVIKQWLQFYTMDLSPNAYEYAHQHQYRYSSLVSWHVPGIISTLPLIMLLSVGLFLVGLGLQLVLINGPLAVVVISFMAIVLLCYLLSLVMSFIYPDCPYKTPATVLLGALPSSASSFGSRFWAKRKTAKTEGLALPTENPEIREIRKLQPRLVINGISWLLSVSQKPETIHDALVSVSKIPQTEDMIFQLLRCNALEQLVQRAKVPLAPVGHDFWNNIQEITPSHPIFKQCSSVRIYFKTIISIWHHPSYMAFERPPAVSLLYDSDRTRKSLELKARYEKRLAQGIFIDPDYNEEKDLFYICLLGDWLLLWRILKQSRANKLVNLANHGFDLNMYADIICIEVCHYHLQKNVTPLYLPRNRGAFIDLHDLLQELCDYGQEKMGLLDDTIWLLLDTLAYIFSGIDDAPLELKGIPRTWFSSSQSPSLLRQETVLLLLKLLGLNKMKYNVMTKKILLCLQMLLPVPMISSSRRKFFLQYQHESPSKHELFEQMNLTLMGLLHVFIPELNPRAAIVMRDEEVSVTELHMKVAVLAIQQLYLGILQAEKATSDYDHYVFLKLPKNYTDKILDFIHGSISESNNFAGICWLLDLFAQWCKGYQLSQQNIQSCIDTTEKIIACSWRDDELGTLFDKILAFYGQLWNRDDAFFGNLIGLSFCSILQNSIQKDRRLLLHYIGTQVPLAVCAFITSAECTRRCRKEWVDFMPKWEAMMNKCTPSALEVYQFRSLKGALETSVIK